MKKLLFAASLALSILATAPCESRAYWNSPQTAAGFGWWQSRALNFFPSMHFHGPLYNYGPYNGGYGYENQFVRNPHIGAYVPADPSVYMNQPGYVPTQWSTINPAFNNQNFPQGPSASPGNFYNGLPQQTPPMAQVPTPAQAPVVASPAVEVSPAPITTTSYRLFRNRSQR